MNDRKTDHGPDRDTAQVGDEALRTCKSDKAQPLPISDFVAHSPDHTYYIAQSATPGPPLRLMRG
jgi:hypothetical protein